MKTIILMEYIINQAFRLNDIKKLSIEISLLILELTF